MNTYHWRCSRHSNWMWMAAVVVIVVLCGARDLSAQGTLVYSFEDGLQGFDGNGSGVFITQDTIGATDGTASMKFDIVEEATFVGALTPQLDPLIGDPPGMDFVVFDLTLTEQFPSDPPGFVNGGITIFGHTQPDYPGGQQFGLQAQFLDDEVSLGALEVGTHEIRIDLTSAPHPLTFVNGTFNDIFGTVGSGANDMLPSGFQIYINKSSTAPWTGYIDNIRVGMNAGFDSDFDEDGDVDGDDFLLWQTGFPTPSGAVKVDGDADDDGDVDGDDFLIWQTEFPSPGTGFAAGAPPQTAVPEPDSALLLVLAATCWLVRRRDKSVSLQGVCL